jgi:hypothetical protein
MEWTKMDGTAVEKDTESPKKKAKVTVSHPCRLCTAEIFPSNHYEDWMNPFSLCKATRKGLCHACYWNCCAGDLHNAMSYGGAEFYFWDTGQTLLCMGVPYHSFIPGWPRD